VREAIRRGLLPIINQRSAAGIVTLPGITTGQILAGLDPLEAVKYQTLLMFLDIRRQRTVRIGSVLSDGVAPHRRPPASLLGPAGVTDASQGVISFCEGTLRPHLSEFKAARGPMPQAGDEFKYDQTRVVSWVDPERVRRMMDGLTGLEVNEAIRDGRPRSQPSRGCWASVVLPCRKGR
jgi:hypothetical protein